jgi:D-alanyl-D-alanine dipeptidase
MTKKGLCLGITLFMFLLLGFPLPQGSDSRIPEGFVNVKKVIPSIVLDMRYHSPHNFIGKRIAGYNTPNCYLTDRAADSLKKVQDELLEFSLSLKIYDAYRPQRAVNNFVKWTTDLSDTVVKREFYPRVLKTNLIGDGYIADRSSHTRGSTVDLTIVPIPLPEQESWSSQELCDCTLPLEKRFKDNSLDMGSGYDCFDPLSWTENTQIGTQQRANRLLLRTLMEKHGFRNYPKEWWHFTLKDEPYPKTYFDFVIE